MQIKIYTIPIPGGEALTEEMNLFLRTKKVLDMTEHIVNHERSTHWCFCIKYLDNSPSTGERQKVDYREILDKETFNRFSRLREIRKKIAQEEAVPPYAIFTDAELAELAKLEVLNPAEMRGVKGIGEKKMALVPRPVNNASVWRGIFFAQLGVRRAKCGTF